SGIVALTGPQNGPIKTLLPPCFPKNVKNRHTRSSADDVADAGIAAPTQYAMALPCDGGRVNNPRNRLPEQGGGLRHLVPGRGETLCTIAADPPHLRANMRMPNRDGFIVRFPDAM